MTLIHMAPQVPHPDRLYQGRVQLLEVKYMPSPLFELHSKATLRNNIKSRSSSMKEDRELPTDEVIQTIS